VRLKGKLAFNATGLEDTRLNLMTYEDEVITIEYNHELPKLEALIVPLILENEGHDDC